MSTSVTLPALGESITEGTVTQWLKKEGDTVEVDEPLLEVSTDKVDTEIPSPAAGVLARILVAEDETVEVGAEIAVIGEAGEAPAAGGSGGEAAQPAAAEPQQPAAPAAPPQAPAAPAEPQRPAAQAPQPEPAAPPQPEQAPAPQAQAPAAAPSQPSAPPRRTRDEVTPSVDVGTVAQGPSPRPDAAAEPYATPLVRKLAAEHGVELGEVAGTGVGGRIRKQDVLAAAQRRTAPAAPTVVTPDTSLRGRTEKLSPLRQSIAQRMVESQQTAADTNQVVEVDLTRVARLRERARSAFERREGVRLTFFPFITLATVEALKGHPKLNAVIDSENNEVTYNTEENLAIAIDTEQGLLAPVIQGAGNLNLAGLARTITDLAARTRAGDVSPDELSGATFSLNNTGSVGPILDTPIINQPQVAILSIGRITKRPVVLEDPELGEAIAVRSMAYLSLTFDHRLIDGADAARFLHDVKVRLEEGAFESEVGLS